MPPDHKVASRDRSPAKHREIPKEKESSRSHPDKRRRSKSTSRERKGRGSSERGEGKRHTTSRRPSRSHSPSRSRSRGKDAFRGRQFSPPRKRPKHSRSRSNSPALLPGCHGARRSISPADYGPTRPFHQGRGPPPHDGHWQPRVYGGPVHREPPPYGSYAPGGPRYGGQPLPRRWAAGPPSRFGGRIDRRSPPPHWAGPINPTTGSPIHEPSTSGPRDRRVAAWDVAAPQQRGASQWGTSIGWERIGNESQPASAGASLRHSPISPVHNRKDGSFDHSTISPQPGLDSAALTHSPVSCPTEAANEKLSHIPLLPAAQEHREESPVRQAAPLEAENTSADKAPQELPGEVALQGRASRLSAPDAPLQEAAATKGAEQGLSGDQVAATEHMLDSKAAQKAQEPSKAGHKGVEGISEPALGSPMLQENGRSLMQQAATAEPPSSSRGALQRNAASPTAAASQQITSEAAQRAEERLKELVLGADYSEKNWFYVDPQGVTQGPCCIAEFRVWMRDLQMNPELGFALKQFSEVAAWKDGAPFSVKMKSLMATVNQLSPSPPSSPNPRDSKLAGNGTFA